MGSARVSITRFLCIGKDASFTSIIEEGDFPEAERAAGETVALPIYSELSESQQWQVVEALASFRHL